jgi:hypothetical protein
MDLNKAYAEIGSNALQAFTGCTSASDFKHVEAINFLHSHLSLPCRDERDGSNPFCRPLNRSGDSRFPGTVIAQVCFWRQKSGQNLIFDYSDVESLVAFFRDLDVKLNDIAFVEIAESIRFNRRKMDEHVFAVVALIRAYPTVCSTFSVIVQFPGNNNAGHIVPLM